MAIAYPLEGARGDAGFEAALESALEQSGAEDVYAIGPSFPSRFQKHVTLRDKYYILRAGAPVPSRLRNPIKKAASLLTVTEGRSFTARHRKLWNEFLSFQGSGGSMSDRVRELYLKTPSALAACEGLRLLDAWDDKGNLAASLLLDYSPKRFTSYILGAHSKKNYTPHAMDLLFSHMLRNAETAGKRYVHLGLGVNEGVLRFKLKWGAKALFPYQTASWQAKNAIQRGESAGGAVRAAALAILKSGGASKRQLLDSMPQSSPFAMIWEVEKNGRISYVSGTAHFFCRSFEPSFRKLFRNIRNVIFEGPLDSAFMERVNEEGGKLPQGKAPLIESLGAEDIKALDNLVNGPAGGLGRLLADKPRGALDIPRLLRTGSYWHSFFTLWTKFLERQGWTESVDIEAWRVANDMGLNVIGMENLEEQLESLSSLPRERVINFFKNRSKWKAFAKRNRKAYLAGDLEGMMGSSAEFPTRTEHVVGRRDQRFRERMRHWLEEGGCAVFVGCAHMVNLRHMLREDGFSVRQKPFGLWPKLHLKWRDLARPDDGVNW